VAAIGALFVAGCGSSEREALPVACLGQPATISRALQRAPARVTLAGGTPLSRCVRVAAHRDGDLQELGVSLTRVADDLRPSAETDAGSALRLGYLVGAVRRGARQTPGVAAQLARRVEQASALGTEAPPASQAAWQRGVGLGEASG
jgi:hypothetical protein